MKNSLQLAINAILVLAVAVLFYLHFANKPAATPARKPIATVKTADSTSTAVTTEEPADLTAVADTDKVGYVESGKLLDGYQGMKDARRNFEAKAKRWEAQNKTLVQGFQNAVQKYQQQAASLTVEQRASTEQQLQGRQQQVGQEQEKLQRQAQEEEAKMTQQVLERMNKQMEVYGKQNGYRLILIAAPSGTIAYGRKDLDITSKVLKHLNTEYASRKK
ncbi:periplasmic chaperone for outer membrane proteins Skp [Hymenobacter gelipurpurascens]|uniref:Periplasmic chaperone for outer membrane proteins Skp n=1 Tax=Hymenobacter gelipurpurascens TaxID=89968 RepID=A0A212TQ79_9BACT|nr:OmpH family outer membrane protein [Hymenobacter gelipurpurascens]SNC68187.1 periplasmic chaperone for outer membrane proteins Skp [Hymenobacter gelipurpurascens]